MGSRRKARELALKTLYEAEFSVLRPVGTAKDEHEDSADTLAEKAPDDFFKRVGREAGAFAETLIRGVLGHQGEIDDLIGKYSENWRIERMARIDRNILRIGIYELIYLDDVPPQVSINEAVELAKKYSSLESSSFVNGILDQVLRERAVQSPAGTTKGECVSKGSKKAT